jgi:hypothetical protein
MRRVRRLVVGGGRERRHHSATPSALERVALAPAFGDDVDHDPGAALLPIVAARANAVGTGRAGAQFREVELDRAPQPDRAAGLVAHGLDQ